MTVVKSFEIWQLPITDFNNGVFWGFDSQRTLPCRELYKKVYERTDSVQDINADDNRYLECLFGEFNWDDRPADYTGRSLSVSDVVTINGVAYFCDSFGWKKLDTF